LYLRRDGTAREEEEEEGGGGGRKLELEKMLLHIHLRAVWHRLGEEKRTNFFSVRCTAFDSGIFGAAVSS
jgi:hypothetical protein